MSTVCYLISCIIPGVWCRARSSWSTFTTRILIVIPIQSRCSWAVSARSWVSRSFKRYGGLAIFSRPRVMRINSLALRLFVSATVWIVVILAVTGVVLSSIYREAVERAFDRRLGVHLRTLVADVATPPEDATDRTAPSLGEPLFELPLSGWYWQVMKLHTQKPDIRSSRSLWDRSLPHLDELGVAIDAEGVRRSYAVGPEDQRLRMIERTVDLGE